MASADDGAYQVSGPGEGAEKTVRAEFETLLRSEALILMRKRGSRTLDETDFNRGYARLLETDSRGKWREIIAEAGVFAGGALLAYGTTLVLQPPPAPNTPSPVFAAGVWLSIAGCVIAGLAIAFRHWPKH